MVFIKITLCSFAYDAIFLPLPIAFMGWGRKTIPPIGLKDRARTSDIMTVRGKRRTPFRDYNVASGVMMSLPVL